MLLAELVETSQRVKATRRRKEKVALLAETLRRLEPRERRAGVSFLSGDTGRGKLGVGYANLRDARDVPPAAEPRWQVGEVDERFGRIQGTSGKGSARARLEQLRELLAGSTEREQEFIGRLVVGELRQGALESIVLEALATATELDASALRRARMLAPDLADVAVTAFERGAAGLADYDIRPFEPVSPMLAQTADSPAEALAKLGEAALELKLDGARVQVHRVGDDVRAFTRRLNDVTAAVPEVVEAVRALPARELVLDGEAIALKPDGRPLPFQVTMRRFGRKLDVARMREKLPLSAFFFDCLYRDGRSLIDAPQSERAAVLADVIPEAERVPRIVTASEADAAAFLDDALDRGHEGVMAKSLDAPYEAGNRGAGWLKLKTAHTLDLVVLAVEWGSGRREGWLSNLHLGARDPVAGGFVMLGKTFKGMTDDMLKWQTEHLLGIETTRDGHVVHVRPELVVEVAFSDVQASPQYPAGLALRFARVKRYRTDKAASDADTIASVRAIHERALA